MTARRKDWRDCPLLAHLHGHWPIVCEVCGPTDDTANRPPRPGDRCFEHMDITADQLKRYNRERRLKTYHPTAPVPLFALAVGVGIVMIRRMWRDL